VGVSGVMMSLEIASQAGRCIPNSSQQVHSV
jgi:hypothetical protein